MRFVSIIAMLALGTAGAAPAHEVRIGKAAAIHPYAPYEFLIGDWNVAAAAGRPAFVTLRFHWGDNHAYIWYGAYLGQQPHFEGMMMWNGAHHNLDTLISMDMEHGLVQDLGTLSILNGVAIGESTETFSEGVGTDGPLAGAKGKTSHTRQAMRPIDADHIALSFEIATPTGWKPAIPGGDHLLMTRVKD